MASAIKGRGALSQPPGRFDKLTQTLEHDGWYEDEPPDKRETVVLPETRAHDHQPQSVARHSLHAVDQSVSRMRTRMCLLR